MAPPAAGLWGLAGASTWVCQAMFAETSTGPEMGPCSAIGHVTSIAEILIGRRRMCYCMVYTVECHCKSEILYSPPSASLSADA
ncbi:hypothetical protein C8Q77DRAFT_1138540 [Trametes polyzona]|nr:hypothetical protein C8Q77DRAFT_1138540 [Trametes polyzona]